MLEKIFKMTPPTLPIAIDYIRTTKLPKSTRKMFWVCVEVVIKAALKNEGEKK